VSSKYRACPGRVAEQQRQWQNSQRSRWGEQGILGGLAASRQAWLDRYRGPDVHQEPWHGKKGWQEKGQSMGTWGLVTSCAGAAAGGASSAPAAAAPALSRLSGLGA